MSVYIIYQEHNPLLPKSPDIFVWTSVIYDIFSVNTYIVPIKKEFRDKTLQIGRTIEELLKNLHRANPEFSYLLVIEGNAANTYDLQYNKDSNYGYTLGYGRALAVYQHWRRGGIDLRKYNTEVLICGSGFNGIDRDKKEENNKRFSIQIIPKIKSPEN